MQATSTASRERPLLASLSAARLQASSLSICLSAGKPLTTCQTATGARSAKLRRRGLWSMTRRLARCCPASHGFLRRPSCVVCGHVRCCIIHSQELTHRGCCAAKERIRHPGSDPPARGLCPHCRPLLRRAQAGIDQSLGRAV